MSMKRSIKDVLVANPDGLTAREICREMGYPESEYNVVETMISQINYDKNTWDGVYINTKQVVGGDDIYKLVTKENSTVQELTDFRDQRAKRIYREIKQAEKISGIIGLTEDARIHHVTAQALAMALTAKEVEWYEAIINKPTVNLKPVDEIKRI